MQVNAISTAGVGGTQGEHDMVNTATFEKAVQAAVKGPEAKKIKFGSHEFNVKPVSVSATRAGGKRVKGQISHCLAWRDDDQYHYEFGVFAGQEVTINQVEVSIDGSFMNKILGDLIDALKEWFKTEAKEKWDEQWTTERLATQSEDAKRRIYEQSKSLLDGSWQGECNFLVVNVAGRLAINEAQVVYRRTKPKGGAVVRDHRTKARTSPTTSTP
jgi:hypothetical protein